MTATNDALAAARDAFTAWAKRQHRLAGVSWVQFRDGKPPHPMGRDIDEALRDRDMNDEWEAWQASRQRGGDAPAAAPDVGEAARFFEAAMTYCRLLRTRHEGETHAAYWSMHDAFEKLTGVPYENPPPRSDE